MRDRDAVTLHPSGHIESPGDLHVSPDVRVAFSRFAGLTSAAYSDDNAILMKLVDAETGEAFAAGAPPPHGEGALALRVEVSTGGADGAEDWSELLPWSDEGDEYLVMIGRRYRIMSPGGPLFELHPPHPCRELVRVVMRNPRSFCPRLHRMRLGEE